MGTKGLVIAIDGPAGSGKSTVAKALARRLGYLYIDTGAMYRCVTLAAKRQNADFGDASALAAVAKAVHIDLKPAEAGLKVFLDGEEVDNQIRTPEISKLTSQATANSAGVREALVERQRQLGKAGGVVMEGRDIGTVVFPKADLKIYFDVSVDERARRRVLDYQMRGIPFVAEQVRSDIERRDQEDRNRPIGPLKQAPDATLLKGDGKTVDHILEELLKLMPAGSVPPRSPDVPERP
ncbi:MAG TPA: (d)CMP kinase [bacterium]|jgi:cytidylate kinase|nr:(d)CMP kinase [bacterium]HXB96738.1 (d)CMP kinase [bacterium]